MNHYYIFNLCVCISSSIISVVCLFAYLSFLWYGMFDFPRFAFDSVPSTTKKPSPPPKSAPYKPVPPPKPKNYRPPPNASSGGQQQQQQAQQQHPNSNNSSNYWNHSPPGTLNHPPRPSQGGDNYYTHVPPTGTHNGHYRYEDDANGGFDSGHGSSLDRHSYGGGGGANVLYGKAPPPPPPPINNGNRNNQAGQYYYNIPPPREQSREARLDLAQHRDQRGSAFELYKKPNDPRSPGHGHQLYMEHNARIANGEGSPLQYSPPTSPAPSNCSVIATVRGWLTNEGGRLESVETGVALLIPPGALPPGPSHLVYFKVCRPDIQTMGIGPPLDKGKGEALLSPMVQCGPKGLRFYQPVELRIPHAGSSHDSEEWNVSLKTSNEKGQWRQIELNNGDHSPGVLEHTEQLNTKKSRNYLSVFVDHF